MSIYYIDGFTKISNPSTEGGFTITDEHGNILVRKFVKSQENDRLITNNYTEFLGLLYCLENICTSYDTVITDSQNSISWSKARFSKKSKRRDLIPLALKVKNLISSKFISLEWVPRLQNLAGLTNENIDYP